MRIVLDTSVVVELDRRNQEVIELIKKTAVQEHQLLVSTITVSEILAGSYRRTDAKRAVAEAKSILTQFVWANLDSITAEKVGEYLAYLGSRKKRIEYPDVAIAATFKTSNADYLLTLNKADFVVLPELAGKVLTPAEFRSVLEAMQKQ